ncbi:MAG: DegV family protein [Lachnospiraceae bacterium]|nr:DegV family protein [Lachnospiraceae bacterium]
MRDDYVLSCCTTADITKKHMELCDIKYICFHYSLDGKNYEDDLEETMTYSEFYDRLRAGQDGKSSQVNAAEFEEYFRSFLEKGLDIIHCTLSSGISGVLNSAQAAAAELKEEYPDRRIYIVDSLCASSGFGLFMDRLAELKAEGLKIEELYKWAEENKLRLQHWFFSSDLTFFIKGGRISKAAGVFGGLMEICPLMYVAPDGTLQVLEKVRKKKKVIEAIVKKMEKYAEDGNAYDGKCYISNSDCFDDARQVAELVEKRFPNLHGNVDINSIGTTIGCHTGPGTVALFFWGAEREFY